MRTVNAKIITSQVKKIYIEANTRITPEQTSGLKRALAKETHRLAAKALSQIIDNCRIAEARKMPVCQDTGLPVVFAEIGQDVRITGGDLNTAINLGLAEACLDGYLRQSVVDPLTRKNTQTNTPAVIYSRIVSGSKIKITVVPKGFGSENMGQVKMLKPATGVKGVKDFVLAAVKTAGANPCPPIVVGVGIGGTMDYAALLAKEALFEIGGGQRVRDKELAKLSREILSDINKLRIGPAGLGGVTTALKVNIKTFPTHIAGLPVAVNIGCWCHRARTIII